MKPSQICKRKPFHSGNLPPTAQAPKTGIMGNVPKNALCDENPKVMVGSWESLEHGGRREKLLHELEEMNNTTTTPSWDPTHCLTGFRLICSLIANLSCPVPADGLPYPAQPPPHLSAALTANKLGPVARRQDATPGNDRSQWGSWTGPRAQPAHGGSVLAAGHQCSSGCGTKRCFMASAP